MAKVNHFRELNVYKKLAQLHLEIHRLSLTFPKFEMYELGSQMRRSSNSAPANTAEGWNNQHVKIYLQCLNRAIAESQETQHHLTIALAKNYIDEQTFNNLDKRYTECIKMLFGLKNSLIR